MARAVSCRAAARSRASAAAFASSASRAAAHSLSRGARAVSCRAAARIAGERLDFRFERIARRGQFALARGALGEFPRQARVLFAELGRLRGFLIRAGGELPHVAPQRLRFLLQPGVGLLGCGRGGAGLFERRLRLRGFRLGLLPGLFERRVERAGARHEPVALGRGGAGLFERRLRLRGFRLGLLPGLFERRIERVGARHEPVALGRGGGEFGLERLDLLGERLDFRFERIARRGPFALARGALGEFPRQARVLFAELGRLRGFLIRAGGELPHVAPQRLRFLLQPGVGLLGCGRGGAGLFERSLRLRALRGFRLALLPGLFERHAERAGARVEPVALGRGGGEFGLERLDLPGERCGFRFERIARRGPFALARGALGQVLRQALIVLEERLELLAQVGMELFGRGRGGVGLLESGFGFPALRGFRLGLLPGLFERRGQRGGTRHEPGALGFQCLGRFGRLVRLELKFRARLLQFRRRRPISILRARARPWQGPIAAACFPA